MRAHDRPRGTPIASPNPDQDVDARPPQRIDRQRKGLVLLHDRRARRRVDPGEHVRDGPLGRRKQAGIPVRVGQNVAGNV